MSNFLNDRQAIQLLGNRINLCPFDASQADQFFQAGSDPIIWQWLLRDAFVSVEDAAAWINEAIETRDQIPFAIFHKEDNKIIGSMRFMDIQLNNKSLEIGYSWLHPNYWRSGINRECKYLLLEYVFETLKFNRVQLKTDARNLRSQQAIAGIGAKKEGVLRSNMLVKNGFRRDSVCYSILREEWPVAYPSDSGH